LKIYEWHFEGYEYYGTDICAVAESIEEARAAVLKTMRKEESGDWNKSTRDEIREVIKKDPLRVRDVPCAIFYGRGD